jgi:elongation factor Ts
MVSIEDIKKLREMTLVSMSECKRALEEANGDFDKALEILRRHGKTMAEKKAARSVNSGVVHAYIHPGGRIGVLVDIRCETDFVAKNAEFQELAHEIALQIASMQPLWVSPEEVPEEILENEKRLARESLGGPVKPANIVEQIVAGKLEKYFAETCLLKQPHIKNEDITVQDLVNDYIAKLGENIQVKRFCRFEI